jgi:hypothetical protein
MSRRATPPDAGADHKSSSLTNITGSPRIVRYNLLCSFGASEIEGRLPGVVEKG